MALIDGDDLVSGDVVSIEEENRFKNHWIQADPKANLGNPQEGMIVYDSDDSRLYLRRASDYVDIWTPDAPYPWANLLMNSGFGVWSQSDANKGVATMAFDSGSVEPVVGELLTGATSGAVGKVISVDVTGGTWGGTNAAGNIELGACAGRFNDNEDINGSVGGANILTVNEPDAGAGVDLARNGEFQLGVGGWTGVACNLASIGGGQVGNCLEITRTAGANQYAHQTIAGLTIGKIYKITGYVKSGTSGNEEYWIYDGLAIVKLASGTSAAGWVQWSATFEAPATSMKLELYKVSATAGTMLFDEATCYEITPCCTAADTVAMDGWIKDSTADIYREHRGANVQDGSFYANKLVVTAAADYVRFPGAVFDNEEWYMQFQSRIVTWGAWVKTSTASHARLAITDSAGTTYSSYHTGGGAYEWLEVTRTINAGATSVTFYVYGEAAPNVDGTTIIYHCQGMLIFGSQIGEGNYAPKSQEVIWCEKNIPSNVYDALLNQSDIAYTDLNIEADSDAMLPKGARVIAVQTNIEDSGSGAGLDVHLELRKDAIADTFFINSVAGKPNDVHNHQSGLQPCDVNGDVDIHLDASGASTLDINEFEYHGVQVN